MESTSTNQAEGCDARERQMDTSAGATAGLLDQIAAWGMSSPKQCLSILNRSYLPFVGVEKQMSYVLNRDMSRLVWMIQCV